MPSDPHLVDGLSGTVSSMGDNVILNPGVGQSVRLFYLCLGAPGSNVADVTVAVRFGAASAIYTIPLIPGFIWARNIGAGRFYMQGQPDDNLILNLSAAESVCWSTEYFYL